MATGIPRPAQLVLDGHTLTVLGPGLARRRRRRAVPRGPERAAARRSSDARLGAGSASARAGPATLGSLALDPASRQLFLGEENGTRIYRLGPGRRARAVRHGAPPRPGGQRAGRRCPGTAPGPRLRRPDARAGRGRRRPGLEPSSRGRLPRAAAVPADARRLDRAAPASRSGDPALPAAAAGPGRRGSSATSWRWRRFPSGEIALLEPTGALFRLLPDGSVSRMGRLPTGHGEYNRPEHGGGPRRLPLRQRGLPRPPGLPRAHRRARWTPWRRTSGTPRGWRSTGKAISTSPSRPSTGFSGSGSARP